MWLVAVSDILRLPFAVLLLPCSLFFQFQLCFLSYCLSCWCGTSLPTHHPKRRHARCRLRRCPPECCLMGGRLLGDQNVAWIGQAVPWSSSSHAIIVLDRMQIVLGKMLDADITKAAVCEFGARFEDNPFTIKVKTAAGSASTKEQPCRGSVDLSKIFGWATSRAPLGWHQARLANR